MALGVELSNPTFEKWIDDAKPADGAAVLHVFAVEDVAASLDSRGNDQRIVERQSMIFGHRSRSRVQADRRSVRVELTEAGQALIEGLFPVHAGDIAAAMSGIDDAELATLERLLRKLGLAAGETAAP